MTLYLINAVVIVKNDDLSTSQRTVPPFLLASNLYDIRSRADAERIGLSVVKTGIGDNFAGATAVATVWDPSL